MALQNKTIHNSRDGKISLILLVNSNKQRKAVLSLYVIFRNFSRRSAEVASQSRVVLGTCLGKT